MIKKDIENFQDSTKCWICDNGHIDGNVKVRHHCHITGKYRFLADGNINDCMFFSCHVRVSE